MINNHKMRTYTVALTPAQCTELLEILWYVARQPERITEDHQRVIESFRRRLKEAA